MVDDNVLYIEDFQYLISTASGSHVRSICPFCNERRSNKKDKCLSIDVTNLLYHCHYCNAKGKLRSKMSEILSKEQRMFKPKKIEYVKPKPKDKEKEKVFGDSFLEYFKNRGISEKTLLKARVTQETEYFHDIGKAGAIAFNFYVGEELVNVKSRSRDKHFKLVGGAELVPYNINSIMPEAYKDGEEKIAIITEGEIDCLTWIECGFKHVISLPNGANNLGGLDNFIESVFDKLDYLYISVDNDVKGVECRNEIIRRFGKENCKIIDYPEPCKDINEVMVQFGKEKVLECYQKAIDLKPDGIQELIDVESELDYLFKHGLQKGATINVPSVDKILSFKTGMLTVVTGVPSHGKALSLDTPIPTPNGWTTMGDIKIGDELFDENGNICKVTFVTPIQYNRNCYKITFSDRSEIICDEDHLWVTRDDKARRSEYRYQKRILKNGTTEIQPRGTDQSYKRTFPKERTTKEILDTLYVENGKRSNHSVAVQGSLKCRYKKVDLHPYVLGLWLSEGTTHQGSIATSDVKVLDNIKKCGFEITKRKDKYSYGVLGLVPLLRKAGVLDDKHIPMEYLRLSYNDRLELLKGLMDGDGTSHKDGTCSYSTSIRKLADNFYELAMTMGLKATITSRVAKCNGVCKKINYNIAFRPNFNCFTLDRKSVRIKEKYADDVNWRYIKKVEKVDSVPVKCIQVDSVNSMYLCGKSMIPTHNTYLLNYMLVRLNLLHKWKIAFFSPEFYPVSLHISQVIETIGGKRFESSNYNQMVYEKMKNYLCSNMFWIDPNDTDISSVMERAKYLIKKRGIKALVIDPFNALTDKERKNQKQDEYISDFLQKLRWFARKYDVAVFLVMHPIKLNRLENGLYPICDLYCCKGAAEIFDKADCGLTVWRNEKEDYAELHVTKIKFRHLGEKGHATFKFNMNNGRYVEIGDADELRKNGIDINTMQVNWDNSNYILDKQQESQVQSNIIYEDTIQPNESFSVPQPTKIEEPPRPPLRSNHTYDIPKEFDNPPLPDDYDDDCPF